MKVRQIAGSNLPAEFRQFKRIDGTHAGRGIIMPQSAPSTQAQCSCLVPSHYFISVPAVYDSRGTVV